MDRTYNCNPAGIYLYISDCEDLEVARIPAPGAVLDGVNQALFKMNL